MSADTSIQKSKIINVRKDFFKMFLAEISRPPSEIDSVMSQSSFHLLPDAAREDKKDGIIIMDAEQGVLALSVSTPGAYDENRLRFVHSFFQAGDWIRYGILVQGAPKILATYAGFDNHDEDLIGVWDRPCIHSSRDDSGILLEWRFIEPTFYDDYMIRERFLKIARHIHFRMARNVMNVVQSVSSESAS